MKNIKYNNGLSSDYQWFNKLNCISNDLLETINNDVDLKSLIIEANKMSSSI